MTKVDLSKVPGMVTMADVAESRVGKPISKGQSRLEDATARRKDDRKLDAAFRLAVWKRDKGKCRVCEVKVQRSLALDARRGEVHHLTTRSHRLTRYDVRNGLLVCAKCHQRLTKHELAIDGYTFATNGRHYPNADLPIRFISWPTR